MRVGVDALGTSVDKPHRRSGKMDATRVLLGNDFTAGRKRVRGSGQRYKIKREARDTRASDALVLKGDSVSINALGTQNSIAHVTRN